jgi:hypothetical protein
MGWIEDVKKVQRRDGISYKEALKRASAERKKKRGSKKGDKSKTHKGDMDYTTKKGDKDFHEGGKDVKKKKRPYRRKTKKSSK